MQMSRSVIARLDTGHDAYTTERPLALLGCLTHLAGVGHTVASAGLIVTSRRDDGEHQNLDGDMRRFGGLASAKGFNWLGG